MTAKQIGLMDAQIGNINADTEEKRARTGTEGFKQTQLSAQADSLIQQVQQSKQQVKNLVTDNQVKAIEKEILNATKHYEKAKPYIEVVEKLVRAGVSFIAIKKFLKGVPQLANIFKGNNTPNPEIMVNAFKKFKG